MNAPRAFVLARSEDVSGVSGTGIVAQGVLFSDGSVALRWTSAWPTSVVFHDKGIDSVRAIHGHNGRTQIVWTDNADARASADRDDEIEALRQDAREWREALAKKSTEYDVLTLRLTEGGVTDDEIDRLADRAWEAVERIAAEKDDPYEYGVTDAGVPR